MTLNGENMTPREIKPLSQQEIENLHAGPKTDAEIEQRYFGFAVYGWHGGHYLVDENPEDPETSTRSPRKFSRDTDEALKILEASPGWRAWHEADARGVTIQLTRVVGDGVTWITGHGRDQSFVMAICKAAIYLAEMVKEWETRQAMLSMAGDTTLEMTPEREP